MEANWDDDVAQIGFLLPLPLSFYTAATPPHPTHHILRPTSSIPCGQVLVKPTYSLTPNFCLSYINKIGRKKSTALRRSQRWRRTPLSMILLLSWMMKVYLYAFSFSLLSCFLPLNFIGSLLVIGCEPKLNPRTLHHPQIPILLYC